MILKYQLSYIFLYGLGFGLALVSMLGLQQLITNLYWPSLSGVLQFVLHFSWQCVYHTYILVSQIPKCHTVIDMPLIYSV